jgi:response regulator of citrate/malate metabolism
MRADKRICRAIPYNSADQGEDLGTIRVSYQRYLAGTVETRIARTNERHGLIGRAGKILWTCVFAVLALKESEVRQSRE